MPSFTIVLPTLGKSRFLAETLESVLGQFETGLSAELLIVTPSAQDLVAECLPCDQHPFLTTRLIEHPPSGPAAAFNCGLAHATGDLIACIADDDVFLPGAFERAQSGFESDAGAELVYGGIEQVDEDTIAYRRRIPRRLTASRIVRKSDALHPSLFFQRRILDRVGMLDDSLDHHHWYEFTLRCHLAGLKFVRVKECLAGKRRHRNNRRFGNHQALQLESKSAERVDLLKKHLGTLPAVAALDLAQCRSQHQGVDVLTKGYDRTVMRNLSDILRETSEHDGASVKMPSRAGLVGTYAKNQILLATKYPRIITRYFPGPIQRATRSVFRSRLFQLKQHDPRPPRLSVLPSGSNAELSIGVVTPNYNTAEYLERTIESVVGQEFPLLQYVVQDGNSNDGSVEIVRRHADRLHAWDSSPDTGQTQAINRGMRRIDTDIMAYLNSDDVLLPGSLSFVSEYFRDHPDVDVIYGHRLIIDGQDHEIGRWVLPPHDSRAIAFVDYIPQETMFWRRRAWQAVGSSLDETFQFAMDWDLILRFRAAGMNFVRVPRFLGAFRVIETQKTQVLLETLGTTEMNRLRKRELGRVPSSRETRRAVRPYRLRQWVQHHAHTLFESAPTETATEDSSKAA